jgi:hydantoinase/carbamoylase family amidase
MPINPARIQADLEHIATFTHTPGAGASRPTFSPQWRAARDYVIDQAKSVGCKVRIDASGNVHARPAGVDAKSRVWMSGSHVDSVPHGGDFDGVLGVVGPLEVLRAAHEDGRDDLPFELVIFAEEEGTTFGLGMLGSRAWVGTLSPDELAGVRNEHGQNYLEAGRDHGVDAKRFGADKFRASDYVGLIELHIEQGPAMWNRNEPVALVTAINGRRQYRVDVRGIANHAGSTRMGDRRDALVGAAEMITALEQFAKRLAPTAVATVGQITVEPNAINVIPEHVRFSIDFRAPAEELLDRGHSEIATLIDRVGASRQLKTTLELVESLPAVAMGATVCDAIRAAAPRAGVSSPLPETTSGALHDSAIIAPLLPTAMIFVASRGGISHNPAEFSRIEDIGLATKLLYAVVSQS